MIEFLVGAGILLAIVSVVMIIACATMLLVFDPDGLMEIGWFVAKVVGVVAFIVLSIYIGHWVL